MKPLTLFLLVLLLTPYTASGTRDTKAAKAPPTEATQAPKTKTQAQMDKFLRHILELKEYLVSEQKFTDPKNTGIISRHLKGFAQDAKETQHDPVLMQENFKFSRQVLEDHISETERIFRLGTKSYARWMMNATVSVCMSCHTQFPTKSRSLGQFLNAKSFTSEFDQAEFLFATRAFDDASKMYDGLISKFPKNGVLPKDLETSLKRQVAYYSRIKRDPKKAANKLQDYRDLKTLPEYLRREISSWVSQFKSLSQQAPIDPNKTNEEQILKLAHKALSSPTKDDAALASSGNPNFVSDLYVSGVLFEYMQSHPKSQITPQILYWLASFDRSLNYAFFYSLAELYLRECIINHASHPIAKKCYRDYEDQVILGYTGSSGTHLPADVKKDLADLKKRVESGGK